MWVVVSAGLAPEDASGVAADFGEEVFDAA